ncbi:hypothetical protein HGRIS_006256 [Hohenbuehelia grisea]|uniref:Protein ral2 n=1 Tax=Hohenbuehelia grisea TaxID=104357 RepID=A0ABR3K076_9AGAR
MLHSISDLTTSCRKTTGDVPAKLVGASTTVVGDKMYLFGGRLVSERRMVSDMYIFDLETSEWEKIPPHPEDDVPRARYFHSADTWNNQLIIFGGMSNRFDSPNPDDLCVLNDVRFYDIAARRWLPANQSNGVISDPVSESHVPRARYAHLSSVTADRLFIIGGQDFFNVWLDDVCVYDLLGRAWVQHRDYPRHCGTYRSVAVSSPQVVRMPATEVREAQTPTTLGPPGTRFRTDNAPSPSTSDFSPPESLIHLPYSTAPTEDHPSDIFLYSNYNFTDVKRELEVFSPLPDTDFTIQDRSGAMTGQAFPPGLRFPTGAILGTHLIIAGTYLAHTYQSFSIWALNLLTMTWTRIEPGAAVSTGSWFRGCLWSAANKFLVFGNRDGNLVDDYNRRLLSWDHVAVVDLEAFGIYQAPPLRADLRAQELGLAAFEERILADFELVCDDGRRIPCSRKLLEDRWPWFKEQRMLFVKAAERTVQGLPPAPSSIHVALPEVPGGDGVDPRLSPRSFQLSEPYPITLALLQYFYSLALLTPLQHAPAVLSQLLVLANTYKITHLETLVKHAMHRSLSNSTSVGVYEVATLCSCRSLQIRALKTVMSYSQKRPSRRDKDGHRPPGSGSGGSGGGSHKPSSNSNGSGDHSMSTRPRGTSDAHWRGGGPDQTQASSSGSVGRDYSLQNTLSNGGSQAASGSQQRLLASNPTKRVNSTKRPSSPQQLVASLSRRSMLARRLSVVSTNTDQEIQAVAELLSPTLSGPTNITSWYADDLPQIDEPEEVLPLDEGLEAIFEMFGDEMSLYSDEGVSESRFLSPISEGPFPSSPPTSSRVSSLYAYSDSEHSPDEYTSSEQEQARGGFVPFHLPLRPRTMTGRSLDSDVPSLSSPTLSSPSLSSPSLSTSTSMSSLGSTMRGHPYTPNNAQQLFMPPPLTPMSPPADFPPSAKQLDIIEERLAEDQEIVYRLSDSGDTPSSPSAILISPPEASSQVARWPRRRSNVEWIPPPAMQARTISAPEPGLASPPLSPPLSPPPPPATAPISSSKPKWMPSSPPNTSRSLTNSPAPSFTPASPTPTVKSPKSPVSRFFSSSSKNGSKSSFGLKSMKSQPDLGAAVSGFDPKMLKAAEKQRKKEEAKARVERLAIELKEKSRKRKESEDARSISSAKSKPRDQAAVFGGMAGVVM